MNTHIKTIISVIAITASSMTIAEAGQNRHERDYDKSYDRSHSKNYVKPRHARHFRKHKQRQHWKRAHRENRHYRKHHYYNRHARRHIRAYEQIRRNDSNLRHRHHRVEKHGYRDTYFSPRRSSPRVSVSTHLHSNNALPIIAGGLIGSTIANDVSHGDPGATFGGAIFGALVGNALARH